jgi:gamma-glutamyl phosphate reductase
MIEFNDKQMDEKSLMEAAKEIFAAEEKDFEKIKSEKWYQVLFHAITLNKDGTKHAVKGVHSLAKLQQLFMKIFAEYYRNSYSKLNALINDIRVTSEVIGKMYDLCVLNLRVQDDISSLNIRDKNILALFLGEYRDANGTVPKQVQRYNSGVLTALQ